MLAAAKMRSPQRIIALDCNDFRLDIARECGADIVLNPMNEDVVARIREITEDGCDVYLEAAGNPASVVQGVNACRKAGTYVSFSVFGKKTTLDWTIIGDTKEVRYDGLRFRINNVRLVLLAHRHTFWLHGDSSSNLLSNSQCSVCRACMWILLS
jgi:erythritol/L-threitol dehydrogenase